jgi:aryl-alcohol dehydrogenase
MAARLVGAATIIAIDVHEDRLKVALELGATHAINARNESPVDRVMKITGSGVHYSLETSSLPVVIRQAVESLTWRGICGILGASPIGTEVSLDVIHLMTAGRKFRGIVEGESIPEIFIPQLIDLYMQGRFPFDKLIKFYPLAEINRAIEDSENGRTIKPVLRIKE